MEDEGVLPMAKVTIRDVDVRGKRVLLRVDFNVPLDDRGDVADDTRIREALPTIRHIIENGGKAILVSHLGRPDGKVVDKLRMDPVAKRLSELLGKEVAKAPDCVGEEVKRMVSEMKEGDVLLLENVRFHPEEESKDPELRARFAKELAELADVYVNDAFGTAHRAHASTTDVAKFVKETAIGFLMERELEYLERALKDPERPFIAILGGAKVSDKIGVIKNLLGKVDSLLIGGAMAYTFLKAKGLQVGSSRCEDELLDLAREIMAEAESKGVRLLLPMDSVVADRFSPDASTKVVPNEEIPEGWMGLDIGPRTVKAYEEEIKKAKTIVWNGPMGVFEMDKFAEGTIALARAIAESGALSIVGGGDSVAAVAKAGVKERMSHISTGGGAFLEFLEGRSFPGVEAIAEKQG
jgi:triosephosphate isomerase